MVELAAAREGALKDIASLSGQSPVFGPDLLQTLRWAANHYVAPLSVLLERAAPPNLPGAPAPGVGGALGAVPDGRAHPLDELVAETARGRRRPTTAMVGGWQSLEWLGRLTPVLEGGSSVLVLAATEAEVTQIADRASGWGLPVVSISGESGKELTEAWVEAQAPGRLVVATPRAAAWHVAGLALAVVLEEGRRAMKDRQTPTLQVRDLMMTRSRIEGFSLVFYGPTPTVEVLAAGADVVKVRNRAWSLVEVVDRREDAPGSGLLAERSLAAVRAATSGGKRSFVFTHRRSSDSSMRCVTCRAVRTCGTCGSRLGREEVCRRCGRASGPCRLCGGTSFEEMGSDPERLMAEVEAYVDRSIWPTGEVPTVGGGD